MAQKELPSLLSSHSKLQILKMGSTELYFIFRYACYLVKVYISAIFTFYKNKKATESCIRLLATITFIWIMFAVLHGPKPQQKVTIEDVRRAFTTGESTWRVLETRVLSEAEWEAYDTTRGEYIHRSRAGEEVGEQTPEEVEFGELVRRIAATLVGDNEEQRVVEREELVRDRPRNRQRDRRRDMWLDEELLRDMWLDVNEQERDWWTDVLEQERNRRVELAIEAGWEILDDEDLELGGHHEWWWLDIVREYPQMNQWPVRHRGENLMMVMAAARETGESGEECG